MRDTRYEMNTRKTELTADNADGADKAGIRVTRCGIRDVRCERMFGAS